MNIDLVYHFDIRKVRPYLAGKVSAFGRIIKASATILSSIYLAQTNWISTLTNY